jgi:hypothetical protein
MPHNLYTTIGDPKIDHMSILVIIRGERRANLDTGHEDDIVKNLFLWTQGYTVWFSMY